MKSVLLISVLLLSQVASSAIPEKSLEIWATPFDWSSSDTKAMSGIEAEIKKYLSLSRAFDPDCYWGDPKSTCDKNPNEKVTAELDALAEDFKKETAGAFNVVRDRDGKKYRDYGGLIQGWVLEKLKSQQPGAWAANFAGDILVNGQMKEMKTLTVDNHELPGLRLATVEMKSGWMIGSQSPQFGSKIIDPSTGKTKSNADFQKIVLFAKPEFNGARLDAWSTALIVGGRKLLETLRENKEYEGQWGYFYVDNRDAVVCSKNIVCNKFTDAGRLIQLPW